MAASQAPGQDKIDPQVLKRALVLIVGFLAVIFGTAVLAVILSGAVSAHRADLAAGFDIAFWWATGFSVLAILLSLWLPGAPVPRPLPPPRRPLLLRRLPLPWRLPFLRRLPFPRRLSLVRRLSLPWRPRPSLPRTPPSWRLPPRPAGIPLPWRTRPLPDRIPAREAAAAAPSRNPAARRPGEVAPAAPSRNPAARPAAPARQLRPPAHPPGGPARPGPVTERG